MSLNKRGLFNPESGEPFKLSRSKLDLFMKCPRCFYLDRRLGISQPGGFPFTLNNAVDTLLKKEFDIHRAENKKHPLMEEYGIDAVPYQHEKMNEWRENFTGVRYDHKESGFLFFGAVDDIWVNSDGELIVVDYKATSKKDEVNIDADWQIVYKRQMEIYQWLVRRNGFKVSPTGYFVYCNGITDKEAFDGKIEFDIKVIPYKGNDDWVEQALIDARKCLESDNVPAASDNCEYCHYIKKTKQIGK